MIAAVIRPSSAINNISNRRSPLATLRETECRIGAGDALLPVFSIFKSSASLMRGAAKLRGFAAEFEPLPNRIFARAANGQQSGD
jgi:hypothetical protein